MTKASARICATGAISWVRAVVGMISARLAALMKQNDGAAAASGCADAIERRGNRMGHGFPSIGSIDDSSRPAAEWLGGNGATGLRSMVIMVLPGR